MMLKTMFPKWKDTPPGNWCVPYGGDNVIGDVEVGLYREPEGDYTLQVFDKDDVVVCRTINMDTL